MASPAHCFYCFEILSAHFDRRQPPSLQRVLDLYDKYAGGEPAGDAVTSKAHEQDDPEIAKDDDEEDEEDEHNGTEEDPESQRPSQRTTTVRTLANPSISRLQASPSSSSRSSSASASVSTSSSSTQLTTPSSTSSITSTSTYASRLSVTASYPLFVTWNTISRSGHKSLRGCIGTFEALPLSSGLASYAITSAFDDTRFSPIPASLLPALSCALTLLADFEPCKDAMDWTIGTHGLRISFNHRNRRHGATYLPDVAVEQGWTKDETVESLMRKAGWDGNYGSGVARRLLRGSTRGEQDAQGTKPWDEVSDFKAVRYTGLGASAGYDEWMAWRAWCEDRGEEIR